MTGAHRAGQRINRLGEELLEFLKALVAPVGGIRIRQQKTNQHGHPRHRAFPAPDKRGEAGHNRNDRAQGKKVSGAHVRVTLRQHDLNRRNTVGAPQKDVESGNLAELFVAQQRYVFYRLIGGFLHRRQTILDDARAGAALVQQRDHGEGAQCDHDGYEQCNQKRHTV